MHHYGVFRRLLGGGAGEVGEMTRWGEIKCPNCDEQDALWEGMERALEESDAREMRLERWLEESETREARLNDRITMLEEHLCLTEEKLAKAMDFIQDLTGCEWPYNEDAERILAALKGQDDE